jgi:hypothetical protein
VPGFLSSRPNCDPPPPHPQGSVAPPPLGSKGGDTRWGGGSVGRPNSDEGTDTLALYVRVYYIPSTVLGIERFFVIT